MSRYQQGDYSLSQDLRDLRKASMDISRDRDRLKDIVASLRKQLEQSQDELILARESLARFMK